MVFSLCDLVGNRNIDRELLEAALEAHRRDHPADVTEDDGEDLNQTPEVRALLADHLRAHYRTWPKIKLPALKGKTPLQAMKTAEGREMVEALLLDFEQRAQSGPDFLPEILNELRATLGLDATL